MSRAEKMARERLANNGRNNSNNRRGIPVNSDLHLCEMILKELDQTRDALRAAILIAGQAQKEWDMAPDGMKAGKILIALAGGCPGYRADIDAIHSVLKENS
jgi:hypothetical protein